MILQRQRYLERIRKFYDSNLIKVLTGVRRCGKSVLLDQIREELSSERGISPSHMVSIDFEDLAFSKIKSPEKLNSYILSKIHDEEKHYIFIDEIQNVRKFEKVLSSLKATENVSIFVTGSNSKLLSGRLASLLVGRCKEFKVMPFTYSEFRQYHEEGGIPLPEKPLLDYLRYGGLPQRLDYREEEDIKDYLRSLYLGIVDRDICNERSKIDRDSFLTVSNYVLLNSGKEFSAESVAAYYNRNNGDAVYRKTVYRYLRKLEEACLISRVKRYDIAAKRNLKQIEKQFAVDCGFLLALGESNRVSPAHALENAVYNELLVRGYDVRIGKTYKGEIDFVAMKGGRKCFIQVAYLLSGEEVIEREFGSFRSVRDPSPKYVMSLDDFDMSRDGITHINVEDWLLGKADIVLS